MGGVPIKALFDTGSTVTLCHAKYLPNVVSTSNSSYTYIPELRSANGSALKVVESKYVTIQLKAGDKTTASSLFCEEFASGCYYWNGFHV